MPKLVLRSSPASPFGRKVKIAMALLGLNDRIEIVTADTTDPASPLRKENPLGKIPTLIAEDGTALFDSRVIAEYLDDLAGGGRLFPKSPERYKILALQALADGIMEAALLQVYEGRYRPENMRVESWVEHQNGKVTRALKVLEAAPPAIQPVHIGTIAVACALGYLDLRFAGRWRAEYPNLVAWLDRFAAEVPAFEATRFKG